MRLLWGPLYDIFVRLIRPVSFTKFFQSSLVPLHFHFIILVVTMSFQNISIFALLYYRSYMCFETRQNNGIIRSPRKWPPQYLIIIITIIIAISIITLRSFLVFILIWVYVVILLTPQITFNCFNLSFSDRIILCKCTLSRYESSRPSIKYISWNWKKVKYEIWFENMLLNIINVVRQ